MGCCRSTAPPRWRTTPEAIHLAVSRDRAAFGRCRSERVGPTPERCPGFRRAPVPVGRSGRRRRGIPARRLPEHQPTRATPTCTSTPRVVSTSVPEGTAVLGDWNQLRRYVGERVWIDLDAVAECCSPRTRRSCARRPASGLGAIKPRHGVVGQRRRGRRSAWELVAVEAADQLGITEPPVRQLARDRVLRSAHTVPGDAGPAGHHQPLVIPTAR